MPVIKLENKESERVWLDARFSNSGVPFLELPPVPGFPGWIKAGETVSIEMGDWAEILYRRSQHPAEDSILIWPKEYRLSALYRVALAGCDFRKGFIWPTFFTYQQLYQNVSVNNSTKTSADHWLFRDDGQLKFISEKCGIDDADLEKMRTEFLTGNVQTLILLKAKVKESRNYLIEPFLKVGGYEDSALQIFVRLTNLSTQEVGTRFILETFPYQAISLIESFKIKDKQLVAKPSTSKYGYSISESYREQGFRVAVSVPIEAFFK